MSKRSLSLLAAITGNEELTKDDVEGIVEGVVEKSQEEVAEMAAELAVKEVEGQVQELQKDVDETIETLEEMEETVEELEEAVEGVETLLNSGTWNPQAAGIMYTNAVKAFARLKGERPSDNDPLHITGAESLMDPVSARLAMQTGLESFTDTIKSYAKGAAAFVVKIFDSVIAWFASFVDKAEKLKKQVANLSKVVAAKDKLKEADKVKAGDWAGLITITDLSRLEMLINSINTLANAVSTITEGSHTTYVGAYNKLVDDIKKSGGEDKDGKYVVKFGSFIVSFTFYTGTLESVQDAANAAKATRISFTKDPALLEAAKKAFKPLTSKPDLEKELAHAVKAAGFIGSSKDSKAASKTGRDTAVAAIKKIEGKEDDWNKHAINLVKSNTSMTTGMFNQIIKLIYEIGAAHVSCVKAHL